MAHLLLLIVENEKIRHYRLGILAEFIQWLLFFLDEIRIILHRGSNLGLLLLDLRS